MRNPNKYEFILIIMFVSFLLIAAIYYIPFLSSFDRREILYTVKINTGTRDEFDILLPVPITDGLKASVDAEPIRLMDELVIEGEAEYDTILTGKGWALQIRGRGPVSIYGSWRENESAEKTLAQYIFNDISMKNESEPGNYSMYYSSINSTAVLSYQCNYNREHTNGKEHHEWGIEEYIMQHGWQSTKLLKRSSDEGWI